MSAPTEVSRDAQDLVDQIVMNIGRDTKKRTVVEMLKTEGASSSSSRGPPPVGSHGTLCQECESLRRWLNGVYEGSLSSLAEDAQVYENESRETSNAEGDDAFVNEEVRRERGDTDNEQEEDDEEEQEEVTLVQGRPGPSRRGRERSRSPTEPRRCWRAASAAGWGANGSTGMDGNAHRPWRRDATPTGAEGTGSSGVGSSERSRRAPTTRTVAGRAREAASHGRWAMLGIWLGPWVPLRVISAVMADVAQAMTNALPNVLEDEEEQEEGDETVTVQLTVSRAKALQRASEVRDVTEVLGTAFDKVSRSLMASLERMETEEARRCAQSLLNKLVAKFGKTCPSDLPEEAGGLLSGFVTFGGTQARSPARMNISSAIGGRWWSQPCREDKTRLLWLHLPSH